MLDGKHTLFICLICLSIYSALTCSLAEGSNISHTQGVGIGLKSVGPTWDTGVDSATGTLIPIIPGKIFIYKDWEGTLSYLVLVDQWHMHCQPKSFQVLLP